MYNSFVRFLLNFFSVLIFIKMFVIQFFSFFFTGSSIYLLKVTASKTIVWLLCAKGCGHVCNLCITYDDWRGKEFLVMYNMEYYLITILVITRAVFGRRQMGRMKLEYKFVLEPPDF